MGNAPKIFNRNLQPGIPLSFRGLIAGLRKMAHAWETLSVHEGRVDWHAGSPKIVVDGAAGGGGDSLPDITTDDLYQQLSVVSDGEGGVKWGVDHNRFVSYTET